MAAKKAGRPRLLIGKRADTEQLARFIEAARESGCDSNDPRVLDVLKGMAARPPQPRGRRQSGAAGDDRKKPVQAKE